MTISKGYSNVFEALEDDPAMAQKVPQNQSCMACASGRYCRL